MRLPIGLLMACLLAAASPAALGQSDARAAYDAGKAAFQAGDYDKARDQLLAASQTDNRNPEVFLWLGRAQYQLGDLDGAVASWTTTLRLAPNEPFAAKMLAALRGQLQRVDTAIALNQTLLRQQLFEPVLQSAEKLVADKALVDAQRVRLLAQQAEALIGVNRAAHAAPIVEELMLRYPKLSDPAQTSLLLGQAYLRMKGQKTEQGLALLRKVVADHGGTPAARTAEFELISFELDQAVLPARIDALSNWIAANLQHPLVATARLRLVEACLAAAAAAMPPRPDSPLAREDTAAIQAATEVYKQLASAADAEQLTRRLVAHIDARYLKHSNPSAAVSAADLLLKATLPRSSRLVALRASANYRIELAIQQLSVSIAATGGAGLKDDPLPQALGGMLAAIAQEYPAEPVWKQQAALAERLRQLGAKVAWGARITEPKAPLAWAVQLALPVLKANSDEGAVNDAAGTIGAVVSEIAAQKDPNAAALAALINAQLVAALSTERAAWSAAAWRQVELLDAAAAAQFEENRKAARHADNARLNPAQEQLLAVLAKIVSLQASSADKALAKLAAHVQPWVAAGLYKPAEDAYAQLIKSLPARPQKSARVAVADLAVRRVTREHARLLGAGLAPPRQLDPALRGAIQELYTLQADLAETDPLIVEVRSVWNRIIAHYNRLEYFDTVEQAITLKPAARNAAADAHAQLQLAALRKQQAQRELMQVLQRNPAQRKITLTPAWQAAIDSYQGFISGFPGSPYVDQCVEEVFGIARGFEEHQAYDVAAGVYRAFAEFAGKQPVLAQSTATGASVVERAALSAAGALEAKARAALVKAVAERQPGAAAPAKLSDDYAAALTAYKDFIRTRPQSLLIGAAIQKISAVAVEYAAADAWDVADAIYADVLAANLALRNPEQIEFARAVCQLGKAMPDHSRRVLAALAGGSAGPEGMFGFSPATQPAGSLDADALVADASKLEEVQIRLPKPAFLGTPRSLPPGYVYAEPESAARQADLAALAAVTQQESRRAAQVANMRGGGGIASNAPLRQKLEASDKREGPVLSEAELRRLDGVFTAAYLAFTAIRTNHPATPTAEQCRGQILTMMAQWRAWQQWQRAATLAQRFLADNPADPQLAQVRLQIARDYLAYAAQALTRPASAQEMLAEVGSRFDKAREELAKVLADFPGDRALSHQAQWDAATSFLTQARTIDAFNPALSRGQYVRAARQLQQIAREHPDHPNVGSIPQTLWQIAGELANRSHFDEALIVWTDLMNFDPTHALAQQAAPAIAAAYQNNLNRPLRAVETYLEINFARGGSDTASQDAIYQIGAQLKDQKRWIEALSVLETFVASFPRHGNAGQALTMIGQIHQANEAWTDAIAAYKRVISEYPSGNAVQEARWSIAECTINLSRWREAIEAYQAYVAAYPKDGKVAEATRRMSILKDLDRYQTLVDEPEQRKSFDAQFQIASIMQTQLANPTKAIIEYRKVAANWPASHLADDALFAIGTLQESMGETGKARETLLTVAAKYPDSPLSDDALFLVGKSYEDESQRLAGLTRASTEQFAQAKAQKEAYQIVQQARDLNRSMNVRRLESVKKDGGASFELEEARQAGNTLAWSNANFDMALSNAAQVAQTLSAAQLADRQDKINAALRRAVQSYGSASRLPGADKAGDALLRMAVIYDEQLKDAQAALSTWQEIVRQYNGTAVAEEASWRIAQYYDRAGKWTDAVEAYKAFLRSYRGSPKASQAQFSIAEGYEHLGKWVEAMDAYTNYINNFGEGPLVQKAREQINWIKTYRL